MREICLVGNSHVAALKLGLDQILAEGDISECRFSVFGTRGTRLLRAQVQDGVLQPSRHDPEASFDHCSGPHAQLRLDDYDDIYFTVGTRPDRFPHFNPHFLLNYLEPTHLQLQLLSLPLATAIAHHTVHGQWFSPLLHEMIEQSRRPIVHFLGCPFWSTRDPRAIAIEAQLQASADPHAVLETLLETIRAAVQSLETERLRLPAPPASVLDARECFSRQEYSRGSVRLTEDFEKEHGVRDFRHMNADYGRQIMESILAQ
jgi:hypothetical protein